MVSAASRGSLGSPRSPGSRSVGSTGSGEPQKPVWTDAAASALQALLLVRVGSKEAEA